MNISGSDIIDFIQQYKWWLAVGVPLVIAIIVVKIVG